MGGALANGGQMKTEVKEKEIVTLCSDVRLVVYRYLKASDLILLISKLSRVERQRLRESLSEG